MKPPVQFLDLQDLERITPSSASSTFAILDPVITIERSNGKLEVAARFNLEVKPYPVFSRSAFPPNPECTTKLSTFTGRRIKSGRMLGISIACG